MLTVNNIAYCRNQKLIFKGFGFSLGLGSGLIISGANGSGKTTLLKIISGLCCPTTGNILWNNQNIQKFYPEFCADINYIGHKNFLKPQLSVEQNLSFYAKISGTEILLPSAIKYFGLESVWLEPVYKISNGWGKKVMLAKLLCCPATIWLLDEPTVNLDKEAKKLLFNLVSIKIREGGLVIIATHDDIFDPLAKKIYLEDFEL